MLAPATASSIDPGPEHVVDVTSKVSGAACTGDAERTVSPAAIKTAASNGGNPMSNFRLNSSTLPRKTIALFCPFRTRGTVQDLTNPEHQRTQLPLTSPS